MRVAAKTYYDFDQMRTHHNSCSQSVPGLEEECTEGTPQDSSPCPLSLAGGPCFDPWCAEHVDVGLQIFVLKILNYKIAKEDRPIYSRFVVDLY